MHKAPRTAQSKHQRALSLALTNTTPNQSDRSEAPTMCCMGKFLCKCFEAIFAFLFAAGVVVLIYWAIFQPHHIRATVNSAALSNLTISSNNSVVSYTLAVNISFYNPSVRTNIYYDAITARLRFHDLVLNSAANGTAPSEFYQRRKTGDVVKLEFDGSRGIAVDRDVARELEEEIRGDVKLELDLDVSVRYVFRVFKLRQKPKVRCWVNIPVRAEEGRRRADIYFVVMDERCKVKY